MTGFHDDEFGDILVRRNSRSSSVRATIHPSGQVQITLPTLAPLFLAKRLVNSSREAIRSMSRTVGILEFHNGMQIGKSHSLLTIEGVSLDVAIKNQVIRVTLPSGTTIDSPTVQRAIRPVALKALRKEAKSYLPRRLQYLADTFAIPYSSVRFSHASTRWGSCSSNGTISLNIALMMQPFEIIDYVLVHELAHVRHMNHSQVFWDTVHAMDPEYLQHRKQLKQVSPHI